MWSNWSTVTGKDITSRHFTWQNGSVFYLLLYNATPGEYICRVFSDYSPQQPEDSATAAVEIIPGEPELCSCSHYIIISISSQTLYS